MALDLRIYPGTERWAPRGDHLARLNGHFPGQHTVHILPRSRANLTLGKDAPAYAFRAFTRNGQSYVFVDRTETPDSIAWLIAHELSHQVIGRNPQLSSAMRAARPRDAGDGASDRFHRLDPEERLADGIASNLLNTRLDREWWRSRTGPVSRSTRYGLIEDEVFGSCGCRIDS